MDKFNLIFVCFVGCVVPFYISLVLCCVVPAYWIGYIYYWIGYIYVSIDYLSALCSAYVVFKTEEGAVAALAFNGQEINGKVVRVDLAGNAKKVPFTARFCVVVR
jgi:hypothetical protein